MFQKKQGLILANTMPIILKILAYPVKILEHPVEASTVTITRKKNLEIEWCVNGVERYAVKGLQRT